MWGRIQLSLSARACLALLSISFSLSRYGLDDSQTLKGKDACERKETSQQSTSRVYFFPLKGSTKMEIPKWRWRDKVGGKGRGHCTFVVSNQSPWMKMEVADLATVVSSRVASPQSHLHCSSDKPFTTMSSPQQAHQAAHSQHQEQLSPTARASAASQYLGKVAATRRAPLLPPPDVRRLRLCVGRIERAQMGAAHRAHREGSSRGHVSRRLPRRLRRTLSRRLPQHRH